MDNVLVIGGGFSGLAAAIASAHKGHQVTLIEKWDQLGGRARQLKTHGFTFDMGPSWYWMPDVFEKFFSTYGYKVEDLYILQRLDPSYQVVWENQQSTDIPANINELARLFNTWEKGAGDELLKFLDEAKKKYETAFEEFIHKPGLSITEYMNFNLFTKVKGLNLFSSFANHVRKYFNDERILRLVEFPVLFLGALPKNMPALYSLMNYADMVLGTWYPKGGMYEIIKGLEKVAIDLGVIIHLNEEVEALECIDNYITGVKTSKKTYHPDKIIASADYHYVDTKLLPAGLGNYSEANWDKRTMSPSAILFYLGIDKKLNGLLHHNLFFDADFDDHASGLYKGEIWPENPLFYVCCPSRTDNTVAPAGNENVFILVPTASDLTCSKEQIQQLFSTVIERVEKRLGEPILNHISYKKTYSSRDFNLDYNAFKGNAYGLANTYKQTAFLKPSMLNKKVKNMVYCGQLTVPGPGVPPSLISGQIAATLLDTKLKSPNFEKSI